MNKIFTTLALFLCLSLTAQEIKTFQELDNGLVKVMVYNGEILVQEGYMTKQGDLWKNTGTWKQYDIEGNITLKVKYNEGKRVETTAYNDNQIIFNEKRN